MNKDLIAANRLALAGSLTPGLRHDVNNRCSVLMNNMFYAQGVIEALPKELEALESMVRSGSDLAELGLVIQRLREQVGADVVELVQCFGECTDAARRIVTYNTQVVGVARGARTEGETLDRLVQAAVDTVALWMRGTVSVTLQELPAWPAEDPNALFQLLVNLLLNARQAFERPDASNRIRVSMVDRSLVIENNGDPTADTRLKRPGLGLWAARELAEHQGLELEVDMRTDGARVSLTFPAAAE